MAADLDLVAMYLEFRGGFPGLEVAAAAAATTGHRCARTAHIGSVTSSPHGL